MKDLILAFIQLALAIFSIAATVGIVIVAIHFITKFW
jgi:hypothetical protein